MIRDPRLVKEDKTTQWDVRRIIHESSAWSSYNHEEFKRKLKQLSKKWFVWQKLGFQDASFNKRRHEGDRVCFMNNIVWSDSLQTFLWPTCLPWLAQFEFDSPIAGAACLISSNVVMCCAALLLWSEICIFELKVLKIRNFDLTTANVIL